MVAAAGFATIAGTTALVAVTDDDKAGAKTPSAVADQAKGTTQPAPAKAGTTRGGNTEDDKDADYWAEHAGNPDRKAGDNTEDDSAEHDGGDADKDPDGSGADRSHSGEPEGNPGPPAADIQKRAGSPGGPEGQNGPEGHSSHDRGHDGQGDHREGESGDNGRGGQGGHREEAGRQGESGGRGQDGHRDSHEDGDKARSVGCDPNDLISAITQANSDGGGTLSLAEKCTYTLTANQDGNGLPEIVQPITIHGNGATIARAANADQFRFFQVSTGGDLKLRHLTLTRGKTAAGENGGAINVNPAGRLDLDHTTLHNNTVDILGGEDAGGIYNAGITTIRNSTLSKNSGEDGSAVYNYYGKLEIETSKITGNVSAPTDGYAAVYNEYGTVTVGKSLFSYNYANGGGGLYNDEGTTDIDKSAFKYNYAYYGGGIYHTATGSLHVRRSTIAYNTASSGGGGGLNLEESATIEDSKIYGNTSLDENGGGIHIAAEGQEVAVRRTKISGNQAPGDGYTGGGIYISTGDQVTLTDVKVTDNTSDEPAGGIHNDGTVTTYGKIKIIDNVPTNCTGSTNPVPNCFG
ncbi:hypothetical protein [Streptomyces sp. NPDC049887]|uniref:right-handed parallel beta-helix repeat-containing protein n=1 Tax=Streptomyces sp. NPDC049887 TaxID=3155654 RepID=UPI0034412ADF